jgi:hypothetical protein
MARAADWYRVIKGQPKQFFAVFCRALWESLIPAIGDTAVKLLVLAG